MQRVFGLLFLMCIATGLFAQKSRKVSGIVRDSTGNGIIAASVKLSSAQDSLLVVTDEHGVFTFRSRASKFTISVSSLGYETYRQDYDSKEDASHVILKPIILKAQSKFLKEVVIKGSQPITIKPDTIEYNAADFPVPENSAVEDILRLLPGLQVDADGNIKAQGEDVLTVRVNGLDFFAGDIKTLSQQFPAEFVEKIQVIDDYGEEANITGIKKGKPAKVLNVVIPPEKNRGLMGNLHAGAGTNNRYDAGISASRFQNAKMMNVRGSFNNTTSNSYSVSNPSSGFGDNQLGSSSAGISSTGSAGVDFRNKLGKKISYYGNYSYSRNQSRALSSQLIHTVNSLGSIHNNLNLENEAFGKSHTAAANVDYQINKGDFIKVSANMRRGDNTSSSNSLSKQTGLITQDKISDNSNASHLPVLGATITFNHKFKKAGRNIYTSVSMNNSATTTFQKIEDNLLYYMHGMLAKDSVLNRSVDTETKRINSTLNLSYSEPISKTGFLQFSYNVSHSNTALDRQTNVRNLFGEDVPVDSLSSINEQRSINSRLNLHYMSSGKKFNYGAGFSIMPTGYSATYYQPDTLVKRNTLSFSPSFNFSYKRNSTSVSVSYSGQNSQPSVNYIQPVREGSNLQNMVVGNPDLRSEFHHSINLSLNRFDVIRRTSLFGNISGNYSHNKIVSNTILIRDTLNSLKQETHYLNSNGFYSLGLMYGWTKLSNESKLNISYGGSAGYNNNISYADNLKNTGKNWTVSQTFGVHIQTRKWFTLSPSVSYSYNSNHYTLAKSIDTDVSSWSFQMKGQVSLFKQFSIGVDASKSMNSGYAEDIEANPLMVNAYLSKSFFKRKTATLRLQAYDLFNEGANISRRIVNNSIVDNRSNRLSRYLIGKLSVNLNRLGGKRTEPGGQAGS